MFIGRERELQKLNELYNTHKFQFPVIYGRRRVGKTSLINEFVKGKDTIFFTGIETNAKQNLENLSKSIFIYTDGLTKAPIFSSFQEALEYIFDLAENKRIVLVIDEYPYVAKAYKALASILQVEIDKHKDTSKLFLILCGSSMSFMENQVLGYKSPLYGRRTSQFKILPFDFFESRKYFKKFSDVNMAIIYGIVGGTPQYLFQMNDDLSIEDNIKNSFMNKTSYLFEEPNNLLQQEVRAPAIYNAIISAIATGSSKLSEISNKVGEETSACSTYLKNLISLGIVKKETPMTEKSTKKTIYVIADNLFRFWYRFVPSNISIIQNEMTDLAFKNIEEQLSTYMGAVFEEICKQYLWKLNKKGEAALTFTSLGRWWGNDPKNKCETEIDIMGTADDKSAIFCECKWTNEKVNTAILNTLISRSKLFHYTNIHLYLFAKTGFTKGCIDKAKELGNVALINFADIMK
ncbi:MAG: ATP-binding protein [Clostridia bacterium]|nr:ATP-binding protein [Clostridia bacterium]MDD4047843.1 ATP-binding protein [Clostridia bacterium]